MSLAASPRTVRQALPSSNMLYSLYWLLFLPLINGDGVPKPRLLSSYEAPPWWIPGNQVDREVRS
jgi:hypothetical protein